MGTRVSSQVYDKVLVSGELWTDRAFVLDAWYLTVYEPIRDLSGKVVGMLGLGILETKYSDMRREVFIIFSLIVLAGMLATSIVAFLVAGLFLDPVEKMVEASGRLAEGDFSARVAVKSVDEFGRLGETFNSMARSIEEREAQIKRHAQERIAGSERLAILGQLAAGVAHEINNPLGGILMYSHLLLDDTGPDDPRRNNLERIARETGRCRDIVRGLLDFARQSELEVAEADINEVIEKTLSLVENHVLFQNVRLVKQLAGDIPSVRMDRGQIQQVLLNIVMNAVEAMGVQGGTLQIASRHKETEEGVMVVVSDSGPGIAPENLRRLFEPFFTTKGVGQGVGLGLAISYGIVEKHGGKLSVESEVGKGATVSLVLPVG